MGVNQTQNKAAEAATDAVQPLSEMAVPPNRAQERFMGSLMNGLLPFHIFIRENVDSLQQAVEAGDVRAAATQVTRSIGIGWELDQSRFRDNFQSRKEYGPAHQEAYRCAEITETLAHRAHSIAHAYASKGGEPLREDWITDAAQDAERTLGEIGERAGSKLLHFGLSKYSAALHQLEQLRQAGSADSPQAELAAYGLFATAMTLRYDAQEQLFSPGSIYSFLQERLGDVREARGKSGDERGRWTDESLDRHERLCHAAVSRLEARVRQDH